MIPQLNWVIYNGVPLTDYDVYLSGNQTFSAPERDIEVIEVPGRNGDIVYDNGRFRNIDVSYESFIASNMEANLKSLRSFLLSDFGYHRLEDTYHPDEFRLGYFSGPFDTSEVLLLEAAKFTLTFNCKPQRFLKSGERVIEINTSGDVIYNQSPFAASPLIRVYGVGSVAINNQVFTILDHSYPYIDVDTDSTVMDCYYNTNNCNSLFVGDFAKLESGINKIVLGSGITKVEITPRWWVV